MSRAKKDTPPRFPEFRVAFLELMGDMTLDQFSKKLEMSRATVGFYAAGQRIPDALGLKKIAEKCNVSADWLLGLSEARSSDSDIQEICKKTGLSEGIVNYLTKHLSYTKNPSICNPIEEFNKIFLPGHLHGLLFQLSMLAEKRDNLANLLGNASDKDFDNIASAYSYLRLFRYEIIESFGKMLDDCIEIGEISEKVNMYFDGEE